MAFITDVLKHASVSALGSIPNISSPVQFYVCALHLRSEPAKALKNMSLGDFKNWPQFTQHRTPIHQQSNQVSIFFQHTVLSKILQVIKPSKKTKTVCQPL